MKAVCPTDPNHKRFFTTAHVTEEWLVDETGSFIEVTAESMEVVHGATVGNLWVCQDCGAEAKVEG